MSLPLIALIGRPNVGKSTLFNRIIGRRKALVQDQPGITRDRQYADADWDGVSFRVVDTGGLEFQTKTVLQKKVTDQALVGIEEADILILVMDGRAGVTALDRDWVEQVRKIKKPKFFVVNKIDSAKDESLLAQFYELGLDPIPISSETGRRVGDLLDQIVQKCHPTGPAACRYPTDARSAGLLVHEVDDLSTRPARHREPSCRRHPLGPGIFQQSPFKIALIGRPNVGKSTLLNRLLGDERAIVDEIPGTTRDPLDTYLTFEGEPYCLIDTAGIRQKGKAAKAIEKFSVIKSLKVLDTVDLALLLLDGLEGITDQDTHVAGEIFKRGKGLVLLVNKWDEAKKRTTRKEMIERIEDRFQFVGLNILFISAKTGLAVGEIFPTIASLKPELSRRIDPQTLQSAFEEMVAHHPLPVFRGRNIQLKGIRQVGTNPPTFIVSSNAPDKIHFSYKRYLINCLRTTFDLKRVPVRILFR